MTAPAAMPHTDAFAFTNSSDDAIDIVIEPWIGKVCVERGKTVRFTGWSVDPGAFEWDEHGYVLYGWSSSEARATIDGEEVWQSFGPCPSLPPSVSMVGFFGAVGHFETPAEPVGSLEGAKKQ